MNKILSNVQWELYILVKTIQVARIDESGSLYDLTQGKFISNSCGVKCGGCVLLITILWCFLLKFHLFIFRQRGRKGGREREKH